MPGSSPSLGGAPYLSGVIYSAEQLQQTLQRVADVAVAELPCCDMAGITLIHGGIPETTVFTHVEAVEIDRTQYETGVGPCLDAYRKSETFVITDIDTERRWPPFTKTAAAHGVRSTLSLPLRVGADSIGALNLYSRSVNGFEVDDAVAGVFAAQAAVLLENARAYWAAHTLSEQLEEALKSRAVIEQAKGILIARHGYTDEEAFQHLSRESQETNTKLRDIAQRTVTTARQSRDTDAEPMDATKPAEQ